MITLGIAPPPATPAPSLFWTWDAGSKRAVSASAAAPAAAPAAKPAGGIPKSLLIGGGVVLAVVLGMLVFR